MRVKNLTINFHGHAAAPGMTPFGAALVSAIIAQAGAANDEGADASAEGAIAPGSVSFTPPPINTAWSGQGGIYIGIGVGENGEPDAPVILAAELPIDDRNFADAEAWAKSLVIDGQSDFRLATRSEAALAYANARNRFSTSDRYWLGEPYSDAYAWCQGFYIGTQSNGHKSYEARAFAVRRLKV